MELVIDTTCPTQWNFAYKSDDPRLDELYELAKRDQWNVTEDINWDQQVRDDSEILDRSEDMFAQTKFFRSLSADTQAQISANQTAFMISQFMHGEQGALLCCGQLVDTVPDIEGKLYAATQVMDEARHVEVFYKYLGLLDREYPMDPALKAVLDVILAAESWQAKCVGMQVLVESLAMGTFRMMMRASADQLLRDIVTLTARDEARHVSFGIISMSHEIPKLSQDEREQLEDLAFQAISILFGENGVGMGGESLADAGIDPAEAMQAVAAEIIESGDMSMADRRLEIVREYMVPNVEKVGLMSERMRPKYQAAGYLA
ncbi:MAG: hypothetical protein JJLCMIEE_03619 [Acidimicrobiales bacterium]|nr:MAG: ferritin-like domain-containing protein [Actinomycetota bacterium]MBV6510463.1 hypothetical protein [Acidimicrobiales bacterium]RIK02488.1 MAG: hypothetical protein DCC48_18170 [Acidobacteriota bacterium]